MSWASHNPELYDDICMRGIHRYLYDALADYDLNTISSLDLLEVVVEVLYTDHKMAAALREWAHKRIIDAEASYWGHCVDAAMEREKYNDL